MIAKDLPSNDYVVSEFKPWTGSIPAGYLPTFFGARTAVPFYAHFLQRDKIAEALSGPREITVPTPTFVNGEMFFEQANIARSVLLERSANDDRFIVVELGGGHGPRVVDSALALRQLRPDLTPFLVVVEALPVYVEWCKHHFVANGLDPNNHWIIPGIVSAEPTPALFNLRPSGFGNQIAEPGAIETLGTIIKSRREALTVLERLSAGSVLVEKTPRHKWWRHNLSPEDELRRTDFSLHDPASWKADDLIAMSRGSASEFGFVSALTLPTILAPLPHVDFMDVDIQFAEAQVIPSNLELLKQKVRLLSIGTHSKEIHANLAHCFEDAGWLVVNDIEPFGHHSNGKDSFSNDDGILTVQNPNVTYDLIYLPQRHNRAIVTKITSPKMQIVVETEETLWSYAVSFQFDASRCFDGADEAGLIIDLEVQVGTVGIGCTTKDFSSYVDRELHVSAGQRRKIFVPIGAPDAASQLMIRNCNSSGRSRARIYGIDRPGLSRTTCGSANERYSSARAELV